MKTIDAAAISLVLLGGAPAFAESSVISPNGSRPNVSGAPQNFVGAVVVQPRQVPTTISLRQPATSRSRPAHAQHGTRILPDRFSS